jgi:hypothetical protein
MKNTIGATQLVEVCTGGFEAEESPLLEVVARERLLKTCSTFSTIVVNLFTD